MDPSLLPLYAATFLAAFLQAITGIGFAMIAGPMILLVMESALAIQVSTALSLLIALLLAPALIRQIDRPTLARFSLGALIGLPFGLALLALASVAHLKLIAGLAVGGLTALTLMGGRRALGQPQPVGPLDLPVGAVSGFFGGCLAMPGPTAALRMTARDMGKTATRATISAFFVLVYPVVFAGQAMVAGHAWEALTAAAKLAPATVAGVVIGQLLSKHVSETLFRRLVTLFLIATAATLLLSSLRALVA